MYKPTRHSNREHGRYAAGLFASTVVMTAGAGVCLMVAFVFAPDIWRPLALVAAGLIGLMVMLRLLMDRPTRTARNSNPYAAHRAGLADFVESFHPKLRRRKGRTFGTNQPPSVDDLRKIKEDSNAWYPSDRRAAEYRQSLHDSEGAA